MIHSKFRFAAPCFLLALAVQLSGQGYDIQANYTKHTYQIPMRDGKHLFTSVYVPKDASHSYPIMLQVQSSWFPLIDRNPQKFVDIPTAKPSDFQKATQHVYHSSSITLLVEKK
jgi:predicted acyl esterase